VRQFRGFCFFACGRLRQCYTRFLIIIASPTGAGNIVGFSKNIAAILILAYAFFLQYAYAEDSTAPAPDKCSDSVSELSTRFALDGRSPLAATCKAWPGRGSKIVAAAYDTDVEHEKRLLVGLIDQASGKVLAGYSRIIQEDATMTVGAASLRIDTGRYDLAPGVRAFGVDLSSALSQGCGEGGFGPVRTLFIRDGNAVRPVLEDFYLSTWRFVKGGPSCAIAEDQEVIIETTTYAIGIGKSVSKGFANLRITETSNDDAGGKAVRKPASREVQYDGKAYRFVQF
jgi:hypothetical protein